MPVLDSTSLLAFLTLVSDQSTVCHQCYAQYCLILGSKYETKDMCCTSLSKQDTLRIYTQWAATTGSYITHGFKSHH